MLIFRRYKGRPPKYPFARMLVGNRFWVPDQTTDDNAAICARMYARNTGKRFSTRTIPSGVLIERIA